MKTATLIGKSLDWAVAKSQGAFGLHRCNDPPSNPWKYSIPNEAFTCTDVVYLHARCYSTDWSLAGPIIEKEEYGVRRHGEVLETNWQADNWQFMFEVPTDVGPTPLIAIMRCHVIVKLGADIDIPEGLV
jgi:Protein of unknown function (DUF2591)